MILITSRDNQKLKYARRVRDGKIRDAVFVEGVRSAEEVLRSKIEIIECFYDQTFAAVERNQHLIDRLKARTENLAAVDSRIFPTIAETDTTQGIIIIAAKPVSSRENFAARLSGKSASNSIFLFLYEINNPSNLGAILRTAEAAGVGGIIVSAKSANVFSPKATRAALGANLRLPIWENADQEEVFKWAAEINVTMTAADIKARKKYTEIDWTVPRLLIFGSEAHGLREDILARVEELIYIPMQNEVESLNLAVSCGIILFEFQRQVQK